MDINFSWRPENNVQYVERYSVTKEEEEEGHNCCYYYYYDGNMTGMGQLSTSVLLFKKSLRQTKNIDMTVQ